MESDRYYVVPNTTEKEIYTVESSRRRCEVMEQTPEIFRIYFGQDGEWLNSYRITNDLKKAKRWADDWVCGATDAPNLVEGIMMGKRRLVSRPRRVSPHW